MKFFGALFNLPRDAISCLAMGSFGGPRSSAKSSSCFASLCATCFLFHSSKAMGINKNRFKNLPTGFEDSLACSICSDVVEDPRQCPDEHLFCKLCIEKRIKETASCPQCPEGHEPLTELQLRPLSRPVRQMMDTLEVVCENVGEGCPKVVKLPQLAEHNSKCEFSSHMVQIKADEHSLAKRKLEESFEESTKRIKVLEQFETNAINRVLELESKLQLARQENATLTSKNTLLEKELASNSSAMDTLQTRNKDLNETLGQIRNDFGGKIESLSNSLKQKDEEIVKFEATLVRVRKDRDFYYHQMMTRNAFIAKQALATSVPTTVVAKSCSSTQTATAAVEHKDVAKPNLEWTKKLDYLKEKLDIDRRLFDILKAVDYDKFYKGEK